MRTHMDVKEGYRPLRPTVKASDARGGPGRRARPGPAGKLPVRPRCCSVERYAPGMGYPGDEGGGPPDSRLDARTRRAAVSSPPQAVPPGWQDPDGEEPGETPGRRRAPSAGSAGAPGDGPAQPGYGGRSGYGGETSYPGGSSGSHRRPDTSSSYPGMTTGPGYSTPGTGYPPSSPGTGSGRGPGRRRREPAAGSDPGHGASRPAPAATPASGGPPSRENAWRRPERRPGHEIQGPPGNGPASGGTSSRGSQWSTGAFRTAGPGGRGPVRGFPPASGAPDPVYPPGQFSPWNAPALRAVGVAGRPGLTAGSGPEISEPEYPLLAVSDPSADATATQTWAVLDDAQLAGLDDAQLAGEWTPAARGPGQDESGRPGPATRPDRAQGIRAADGPAAAPGDAATGTRSAGPGARDLEPRDPGPGSGTRGRDQRPPARGSRRLGRPGSTGYPGETGFPGDDRIPGRA